MGDRECKQALAKVIQFTCKVTGDTTTSNGTTTYEYATNVLWQTREIACWMTGGDATIVELCAALTRHTPLEAPALLGLGYVPVRTQSRLTNLTFDRQLGVQS